MMIKIRKVLAKAFRKYKLWMANWAFIITYPPSFYELDGKVLSEFKSVFVFYFKLGGCSHQIYEKRHKDFEISPKFSLKWAINFHLRLNGRFFSARNNAMTHFVAQWTSVVLNVFYCGQNIDIVFYQGEIPNRMWVALRRPVNWVLLQQLWGKVWPN